MENRLKLYPVGNDPVVAGEVFAYKAQRGTGNGNPAVQPVVRPSQHVLAQPVYAAAAVEGVKRPHVYRLGEMQNEQWDDGRKGFVQVYDVKALLPQEALDTRFQPYR